MWPQLIVVTLLAAIAQGVAGFGFTLLAVSFYLLILRSTDAVQLVILINLAISVVLVARLWHAVPRRLWALLAGGGLLGFPVGLWVFAHTDLEFIELAVAGVTIAFAVAVLLQETRRAGARGASPPPAADDVGESIDASAAGLEVSAAGVEVAHRSVSALAVGMSAGALTSSLGMPGPPVALYLTGLGLDKTTFRALALSTFIVMQAGSLLGQSLFIGIDTRVWAYALVLVPVAALGATAGHRLCHHVTERVFRRLVLLLLLATGAYMLYQALTR